MTINVFGYANHALTDDLAPFHFDRRDQRPDVETQKLLDFCGEHGITSDIEMIKI